MSRLTLRLPETLHQQLTNLAESEGVSLNQYIVYALTRQATLAYSVALVPKEDVQQQKRIFESLQQELGKASASEIQAALAEREPAEPERELTSGIINRFQKRIEASSGKSTQG
jgi:uncharacterized protein (DUF1778 family)